MSIATSLAQRLHFERIAALHRKPFAAHAVALLVVALATLARIVLDGHISAGLPFLTYYPAIIVATLLGGLAPGVLALAVSAATADYLFMPPVYSLSLGEKDLVALIAFVALGGIDVAVVAMLNAALGRELAQERGLRQAQDRQQLLVNELRHRAQNLITVIQTIAQRSLRKGDPDEKRELMERLVALGRAHALLADAAWRGAPLAEIVQREFAAFSSRVSATGCDVMLNASASQQFALIVHELATNAIKHGSLSVAEGRVAVEGSIERMNGDAVFRFAWRESDGPAVSQPARSGFGSTILLEAVRGAGRDVAMEFAPSGLSYRLTVPLGAIAANDLDGGERQPAAA